VVYGLYLSATGVLTNSYRQDVIANNIANAETVGFKKDLALFQQRLTAAQEQRVSPTDINFALEGLGGGMSASPTLVDSTQGELEPTNSPLDVAIEGDGYFMVEDARKQKLLTRNGQFMLDRAGNLILAGARGEKVLDSKGNKIVLDGRYPATISKDGVVSQREEPVAQLGLFDVPDRSRLHKQGDTLLTYPEMKSLKQTTSVTLRTGFIERANVDPARELAILMDAQRQLEANANMIRYQDQTLARLVNEVGKIG